MRKIPLAAVAALLLLLPSAAGATRPKVVVAPVLAEGDGGALPAEPWREAVSARLADRFEVLALPHPPTDQETALSLARAARADYVVEVRYTRMGAASTLDLTMRDPSGRVVDTVTADVPAATGGVSPKGDQARLTIAAVSRLAAHVAGEGPAGLPAVSSLPPPPAGIVERGVRTPGAVDASFPAPAAGGRGIGGWFVASGGTVRYYPAKGAETLPPEVVTSGETAEGVTRIVALSPGKDGRADALIGRSREGKGALTLLRRGKDDWKAAGEEGEGATLLRRGGSAEAPLLFFAASGIEGLSVSARPPSTGRGTAPAKPPGPVAFPGRSLPAGKEEAPVLLAGGGIGWARIDAQGRLAVAKGDGEELRSAAPAGPGKALLLPTDLDGDGAEELLVVTGRERPGALFGALSVPSGSEAACFVLPPGGPPVLAWRLPLPFAGIVDGWADRSGTLHFLLQEADPSGAAPGWRTVRVR